MAHLPKPYTSHMASDLLALLQPVADKSRPLYPMQTIYSTEGGRGGGTARSTVSPEVRLGQAVQELNPGAGKRVWMHELKDRFPDMSKGEFDAAVKNLMTSGKIVPMRLDNPMELKRMSPEMRQRTIESSVDFGAGPNPFFYVK